MKRREVSEVLYDIKKDFGAFDKGYFIEGAKADIRNLYYTACKGEWVIKDINCTKDCMKKIQSYKDRYRINDNIDTISIQFVDLYDYIGESEKTIKLYVSVVFYDQVSNNPGVFPSFSGKELYWSDTWIVSYTTKQDDDMFKCDNCGAEMKRDEENNLLECEYCGTKKYCNLRVKEWKIKDIEVV